MNALLPGTLSELAPAFDTWQTLPFPGTGVAPTGAEPTLKGLAARPLWEAHLFLARVVLVPRVEYWSASLKVPKNSAFVGILVLTILPRPTASQRYGGSAATKIALCPQAPSAAKISGLGGWEGVSGSGRSSRVAIVCLEVEGNETETWGRGCIYVCSRLAP